MKIGITVTFNDGNQKQVDAVFADFVAFERSWNRSVTKFDEELRLTDLAWLAWHSEKRRKQHSMQFDPEWIETIESIEIKLDEEPAPLDQTA